MVSLENQKPNQSMVFCSDYLFISVFDWLTDWLQTKTDNENLSKRKLKSKQNSNDGEETEPETGDSNGSRLSASTVGASGVIAVGAEVAGPPNGETEGEQEVELIFKPVENPTNKGDANLMQTRFIKTTMNATVDHLAKYLSMRHLLDAKAAGQQSDSSGQLLEQVNNEASLFVIYVAAGPGEFKPLSGQTSLEEINEGYFRANKPLELHYAYKPCLQTV